MDIINIHLPIFHNKFLKKCIAAGGEKNKINEIFGIGKAVQTWWTGHSVICVDPPPRSKVPNSFESSLLRPPDNKQ